MNIAGLFRLYTTVDKLKGNDIDTGRSRVLITDLPMLVEQKSKQTLFILKLNDSICRFFYKKLCGHGQRCLVL